MKEEKLSKYPAPHFEAWKLVSGAKTTGRIKMVDTENLLSVCIIPCDSLISGQLQGNNDCH